MFMEEELDAGVARCLATTRLWSAIESVLEHTILESVKLCSTYSNIQSEIQQVHRYAQSPDCALQLKQHQGKEFLYPEKLQS